MVLFIVNFGYWYLIRITGDLESFNVLKDDIIKKIFPSEKMQSDFITFYEKYKEIFLNYSASLIMFLNILVLFPVLQIIRWVSSYKDKKTFFCLDICFFKLPDNIIFLYILVAGSVISLFFYEYKWLESYKYLLNNTFIIFSLLYLFNGLAIVRVYTKARFLPFKGILLINFILSWFFPEVFFLIIVILFLVGLFDFAFDLRKKALHHISVVIINSRDYAGTVKKRCSPFRSIG